MTNEELKKKIVKVLKETINWTTDYSIPIGIVYNSELDKIADALIDALKDEQQSMNGILTNMSSYMKDKLHELKHCAEVAEKMFDALHEKSSMYMKVFSKEWYKQQAEKELAEEGKDD